MKILFLSVEVAPFAKVGGLADVAGSLPKSLRALGLDVRIAMPGYNMVLNDPRWKVSTLLPTVAVQLGSKPAVNAWVSETTTGEVPVLLVGGHEAFERALSSQTVYGHGFEQYLFFCKACLRLCEELQWIPDVIHCNDWHTGFMPVMLRLQSSDVWREAASVFTIHNFAYQGEFGHEVLEELALPFELFNMDQLETYGRVNFLKTGCVFSDVVNTVSPTYAAEIQTPEYGCRLEGLMRHLNEYGRLRGILNGIDEEVFNPVTDPDLPQHYSKEDPSGKRECRAALLREVELPDGEGPVLGVVSRLSEQKGMDLMLEALPAIVSHGAKLIVQGLGSEELANRFRAAQAEYPDSVRFVEKFDAEFAQRVYGGVDIFLMPSAFEPCGLGQMIALRYGSIPVVRRTGGLADTVFENINGFVFENRDSAEFAQACQRAFAAYAKSQLWSKLMQNALSGDYGWSRSATEYVDLYQQAVSDRRGLSAAEAG